MLRKCTHILSIILLVVCATYVGIQTHCSAMEAGMQIAPATVGMCSNEAVAATAGLHELQEEAVLSRTNTSVTLVFVGFAMAVAFMAPRYLNRSANQERMKRLSWIWARKMPFAKPVFLPYFNPQRDA